MSDHLSQRVVRYYSMSIVPTDTGTTLMAVGGAAITVGTTIAGFGATLPDTTLGSPRDVAVSVGMAITAVGGALVSIGAFIHNKLHGSTPPPVQTSKV